MLSFLVDIPAVTFSATSAAIHSAALPGANAPIIFDLGGAVVIPGSTFGEPPAYRFFSPFDGTFGAGPFTLTSEQISQLQGGLWYVEITSFTMPDGQLRGQILPVPEPSALTLLSLGAVLALVFCRQRRHS